MSECAERWMVARIVNEYPELQVNTRWLLSTIARYRETEMNLQFYE